MAFKTKIIGNPHDNDLGFNQTLNLKQEERVVWYEGKSDKIQDFYLKAIPAKAANYEEFRNTDDYFWAVVSREPGVKCTHSGLPNAIISALVNITGEPEISITKRVYDKETESFVDEEDLELNELVQEIIEDNDLHNVIKTDQIPYMVAVGDGAYLINFDKSISDLPILEFIDGRNTEFEIKSKRIVGITIRKYYKHEEKNYMLTDRRTTETYSVVENDKQKNKRMAVIEYNLYELVNDKTAKVKAWVELNTIPQTASLKKRIEFRDIDEMLAVPCIYKYDKANKRGKSIFDTKLDLFDDLDQNLSQSSLTTRLSTPAEYVPDSLIEYDDKGEPKKFQRYDRRYIVLPHDKDSATGIEGAKVQTTQPILNFEQYSTQSLEIVHNICTGLMSPTTLGLELARKDNAAAQREREKVSISTRDDLIATETGILKALIRKAIKLHYAILQYKENTSYEYEVTINYPEYANPSFENKLAYLTTAYANGGISAKQYVNELWGKSLNAKETQEEIEWLEKNKNAYIEADEEQYDPFMI